jgi:hypothetical protein
VTAPADPRALGRRPYLGSGWRFPVRPSNGRLSYAAYEEDVEQAIGVILQTSPGERVMLPGFGAGLRDYVFAVNSPATRGRVEDAVREALLRFEPRIAVERVEAMQGDESNVLLVEIDYVVQRTNSFYNRVYPFYLTEAG